MAGALSDGSGTARMAATEATLARTAAHCHRIPASEKMSFKVRLELIMPGMDDITE